MENLVHYYNLVEHLLVVTGKWVRIYALYEDLIGRYGEPSEKSKKVFTRRPICVIIKSVDENLPRDGVYDRNHTMKEKTKYGTEFQPPQLPRQI